MWTTLKSLQHKREYHRRCIKNAQFFNDARAEKHHRAKMHEAIEAIQSRRYR